MLERRDAAKLRVLDVSMFVYLVAEAVFVPRILEARFSR